MGGVWFSEPSPVIGWCESLGAFLQLGLVLEGWCGSQIDSRVYWGGSKQGQTDEH